MMHEIGQHAKLMARQFDETPIDSDFRCASVESDRATMKLAAALSGGPANQGSKASQYLFHPERFRHVVVGAAVDSPDLFVPASSRGQHQHWDENPGVPPPSKNGEPIDL